MQRGFNDMLMFGEPPDNDLRLIDDDNDLVIRLLWVERVVINQVYIHLVNPYRYEFIDDESHVWFVEGNVPVVSCVELDREPIKLIVRHSSEGYEELAAVAADILGFQRVHVTLTELGFT